MHIFDIVSKNINKRSEVTRLVKMSQEEKNIIINKGTYREKTYTLFDFVNEYCFNDWEYRDHCLDVSDYLKELEYDKIIKDANVKNESFLIVIELIYNFWLLAKRTINRYDYQIQGINNFSHLKRVMDDLIAKHNYKTLINDENTQVQVVPNKPEVNAVVEVLPDSVGFDTVMFNHHDLKGNLEEKKRILVELWRELEPYRDKLVNMNKGLEDDISCLLNNMDIRHNNTNEEDPKQFKSVVGKMDNEEIEKWYNELYQMLLLGFLTVNNIERRDKIKELRKKMKGQ